MSLLDNLISYWKLDEASGNAIDAHGANTLTQNGTVGTTAGKIGNARTFSGSPNYLSTASNSSLQVGDVDFTAAFWVRFNSLAIQQVPVGKWSLAGSNREYRFFFQSASNRMLFQVSALGTAAVTVAANLFGGLSTGVWYYVVGWHDATANTISISVNGISNSASHSTGVFAGSSIFGIGRSGDDFPTDGAIDECGVWKRTLNADERAALYNGGNGLSYDSFGGGGIIPILRQHYAAQGAR
jgi:hypothetical protein